MKYYKIFERILNTFLLITGIPALVGAILDYFGYDFFEVFLITLFIVWVARIELRLKDIEKEINKKQNGRKK
jgi:hypothetical protein